MQRSVPPSSSLLDVLKSPTVWVAALGYFVDIYDLVLFAVVRVSSLRDLGLDSSEVFRVGASLMNHQMTGMLIGGLFWGVLGDRKGRKAVLFGSILLYSMANLANAFITDVHAYSLLRFVAGFGLAGELGAAVTLVCEVLPVALRGYGTTITASVGLAGAILAGIIGNQVPWRVTYIIGGSLGLLLLLLRMKVGESEIFSRLARVEGKGGTLEDLKLIATSGRLFRKYVSCILIGIPIWFATAIFVAFAPEFAKELGISAPVAAGTSIMANYIGAVAGDLSSGLVSQWLRSRKKAILAFLCLSVLACALYLAFGGLGAGALYLICGFMGFANGYWAVFVTTTSEQFGTNLRATATTSAPNFVRGSVVPVTLAFQMLAAQHGFMISAIGIGLVCYTLAFWSALTSEETYGKSLDYLETASLPEALLEKSVP